MTLAAPRLQPDVFRVRAVRAVNDGAARYSQSGPELAYVSRASPEEAQK